jgi:AraC-like DNA-binding protein
MPGPLDSFPLVRTTDLDQLRPVLATLFQDSVFDIGSDRDSVTSCINYCPLQHTGLMYGNFGAAIRASFGEMRFYVQGITIRGTGEQLTNGKATSANVGGLLSPRTNLRLNFGTGFELIALNIEADALTQKLGAIIGVAPSKPILFEVDPEFGHPAALRLRRLIEFLAKKLNSGLLDMPVVALVEIEQALMMWFLVGNRHNYSHLLNSRSRSAGPWQVKRAEEYIEANWDQPLTIEVLADVTGASARSLFHAFKQSRGYSPMAFIRQVRLQRAWLMLNTQGPALSVTEVAYMCGFSNLGHFAGYFRDKFGETPSAVLSRAKNRERRPTESPPGRLR